MNRSTILRREQGFALVAVLVILVLLLVLVLGFFLRTSTERTVAASHQEGVSAELLADTAVDLVKGQIHMATSQGGTVAWASQPGMIRTFDNTGNALKSYKLYSADELITSDPVVESGLSVDAPPDSWADDPALWTDLNAPIAAGSEKIFPILDPHPDDGNLEDASDNPIAEGFRVVAAPGATSRQPVPMPVRWLYMLSNGSLVAPTGGSGKVASVPVPDGEEIVGRIAFWTDDDTTKVNLNTASEGTYWDTPRMNTEDDRDLAQFQPARNEWQSYPGHPATTSLSAVFPDLALEEIYQIAPRIVDGGSRNGTTRADDPIVADNDRLYASTDEAILSTDNRTSSQIGGKYDQEDLARARFFLTTHSRAPETNLFDLPRIACWPIFRDLNPARVTVFDKLIAFCSSIGTGADAKPYYFQRADHLSPRTDIEIARNQQLYSYLRQLTSQPVPGFGGNFLAKYGADRDQILTEIFDYIRSTNLWDFLLDEKGRYTPYKNHQPGIGWVTPSQKGDTMGFGRAYTLSEFGIQFICNAVADDPSSPADESAGSNVPANRLLNGQLLNPGEKCIQAMALLEFFSPSLGWNKIVANMRVKITGLENLTITAGSVTAPLFPKLTSSQASVVYSENANAENLPENGNGGPLAKGRTWGGTPGTRYFLYRRGAPARGGLKADKGELYPFIGEPIRIPAPPSGGTMEFSGGDITVQIYADRNSNMSETDLIQTIHIKMPPATLPIPDLVTEPKKDKEQYWALSLQGPISGNGRLYYDFRPVFHEKDVVRTVVPRHGDYRLVAASHEVPASVFAPPDAAAYQDPSRRLVHTFTQSYASNFEPGFGAVGKLLPGINFPTGKQPDFPADATASPALTGDFDSGLPTTMDGPFINKPDEGNARTNNNKIPYFDTADKNWTANMGEQEKTFSAPNRQIPSPGIFGSLSTGVKAGKPWQTLLFRPQKNHPAASTKIPDHLFLDLFWMPVVEPYAISDRFSTAGKINLNHQILPFTYIKRPTGLVAVLKCEKVAAIPNSKASVYKGVVGSNDFASKQTHDNYRLDIDIDETLKQLDTEYFDQGKIFRSATEICDVHIVPVGQKAENMESFWSSHALTADNLRERIYTTLYPRLTTKSNTYTVHYRVQSLKKSKDTPPNQWDESRDSVRSEQRGSVTIERFIDANDPNIPDYAANPTETKTLGSFYRWRTVVSRKY